MTTITYTKRPFAQRLRNAIRRAYLRVRIASAEQDATVHEAHAVIEPLLAAAARQYAEALRVEPDTLGVQTLVPADRSLWIEDAQQFANGTLTFVGALRSEAGPAGPKRLYLLSPRADSPQAVTGELTTEGTVDFLWDDFGEQVLIVTYAAPDDLMGDAALRRIDGTLYDLGPLTGPLFPAEPFRHVPSPHPTRPATTPV